MQASKPKSILICSQIRTVGGVETHLLNLCQLLVKYGAEITFASRYSLPHVPIVQSLRKVPVKYLSTPFAGRTGRLSTAWAMMLWPRYFRKRFDVIYTFDTTWFAVFLSRFLRQNGYIFGSQGGPPQLDCEYLHETTIAILDGFIVESAVQAEAYRPLGLRVASIPQLGHVGAAPRREPRLAKEFHVAFLGRMDRNKGMFRLLDIWENMSIGPARLEFWGDGTEKGNLEGQIKLRGLTNVHVRGAWTPEQLRPIFADTDLVVLPSDYEGLPLVLLESMAYGVPFVASDVGAISSLAVDNPDVCVVPLENRAIASAIREMVIDIRSGKIRGDRLQEYHRKRYGHQELERRWAEALLEPERVWGPKNFRPVSLPQLLFGRISRAVHRA